MNGPHNTDRSSRTAPRGLPGARRIRAEQTQRSARRALRDELVELHQLSLEVMSERGILPPVYGGAHLGAQAEARIIGLSGWFSGQQQAFMGLALQPKNAEPNPQLAVARDLAGYAGQAGGAFSRSGLTLYMARDALTAHPPADVPETIEHICQDRPFAVFPVLGPNRMHALEARPGRVPMHCQGVVLCAESQPMLETAVWDYRLSLALERECEIIAEEGGAPGETLPAPSVPGLVAYHDLLVVRALRLYGCTSPLRTQQAQLDVLRDDSGDLRVPLPLKPAVEPVALLDNDRRHRYANQGMLLHLRAEGTQLASFWPQIRASRYFCIRQLYARIDPEGWRIVGFAEHPALDWLLADDLERLYRLVHLYSLHECLAVAGLIDGGRRPGEGFYDALDSSGRPPRWLTSQGLDHEP